MKSVKNAYKTSVWNESGTNHSLVWHCWNFLLETNLVLVWLVGL